MDNPQAKLEQHIKELSTLNAIGDILNQEIDFEKAIGRALEKLVKLTGLTTGWVFLTRLTEGDSHQAGFYLVAKTGLPPALNCNKTKPLIEGSCDCQWLFKNRRLDKGVNIVHCSRLESARGDKAGLEIHASMPLLGQSGPVGILNLAAPGQNTFSEGTLQFLTTVGKQLGTAFERSRLQELHTQEASYLATLEERQRLATEMHDSVTQLLFATDLSLNIVKESQDEEQRYENLGKASELVSAALNELKGLIEVLRPADLSKGLQGALSRLVKRSSTDLETHLALEKITVPDDIAKVLYRIAQEAMHNTLKHARASQMWIVLEQKKQNLLLRLEDNGKGLPKDYVAGIGLTSMSERAQSIQGTLNLLPRRGGGLKVEIEVPWET